MVAGAAVRRVAAGVGAEPDACVADAPVADGAAPREARATTCSGRFANPVTDFCWSCLFPIRIGRATLIGADQDDAPAGPGGLCHCRQGASVAVGLEVSFWEPIRRVDVTINPFCAVSLGGVKLASVPWVPEGTVRWDPADGTQQSWYHVHWYTDPFLYWSELLLDAITVLVGQILAAAYAVEVRQRMDAAALAERPFQQLARAADRVRDGGDEARDGDAKALLQSVAYLRALLDACRAAARSTRAHLEEYGVSIEVVFQVRQLCARTERIDALLQCLVAPQPAREFVALAAALVRAGHDRRSVRALFAHHYSLLARKVTERSAETGEHYIARDRAEYWAMLRRALGGGAVVAATVFVKFMLAAIGFAAFWAGLWAGINYAASFVAIHLAHWTLATKQPAMTAPALAARLADVTHDESVERFVDEVAHLIRTQVAGIFGNVAAVAPLALGVQLAWNAAFGAPLVGEPAAQYVLHSLTLLGPTALYAALTGVLLFVSSLIGGWFENWFVWHRLDSAIEWNPRIVARLGADRARRWARWWRDHVSGLAGNVSLGLMLGVAPVVADFFGLPLDVRHVTLAAGQLAAAAGALGPGVVHDAAFWWCVASLPVIGALNLGVSFLLAFRLALRSRGLLGKDRSRVHAAIRRRMLRAPGSFLWPPAREARAAVAP